MKHEVPGSFRTICCYCGEEARAEIFEAWGHEVMFDCCCEAAHDALLAELDRDGAEAAAILREMEAEALLGHELRRLSQANGQFLLDFRLQLGPIRFGIAKAFVQRHHEHCPPPAGWRYGAGCWNGRTLVGVAMVGRPVARRIDAGSTVEVNRLCLDRALPDPLRRNAASMLYGFAAREARRRGFSRIITYTLEEEPGTSLRAAGWREDGLTKGGSWSRDGRPRSDAGPLGRKTRWCRDLRQVAPCAAPGVMRKFV